MRKRTRATGPELLRTGCRGTEKREHMTTTALAAPGPAIPVISGTGNLSAYLAEIRKFPMLQPDE